MSVDSTNGHIEDEDTQDEVDVSDTVRPEPARDTRPDLSFEAAAAAAMRDQVVETIDISRPPIRENVTKIISGLARVDETSLKNMRMDEHDGQLTLAEYLVENTSISYLYLHRECKSPEVVRLEDRVRIPVEYEGETVLLEVYRNGDTKLIHRWLNH